MAGLEHLHRIVSRRLRGDAGADPILTKVIVVVAGYPACGHPTPQFLIDRERAGEVLLRSQGLLQGNAGGEGGTVVGIRRKALGIVAVDIIRGGFTIDEHRTVQQLQRNARLWVTPVRVVPCSAAQTQASGFPGFTQAMTLATMES